MAINDIMLIAESPGFGMLGHYPFGDFPPFTIGANLQGLAVYNGTWPFANLMTTTSAWDIESGTGTYDISLDDEVNGLTGDLVLRKYISLNGNDTESPQLGTYNVRWEGTGEVSVPSAGLGFTSGGSAQFTLGLWLDVLEVRVRNGTISNLIIIEPDVTLEDYDNGEIFSPRWLSFVNQFNYRVVRTMDWSSTNGNLVSDWSERTHVNAMSYQHTKRYNTRLWDEEEGAYTAFIPYEVQCQLANTLNCDLWVTIPTRASDDYIQQLGTLVEANLNSNLNVYVEYSNETWNSLFFDTQAWVNYIDITHREGSTVVGTNFVSTVGAHGLSEGQVIRILQSPTSDTRTIFGDQIWGNSLTFIANNVTTNTFELTINGSGDPVVFKEGLTSILWHPVNEAPAGIVVETTDFNHGQKSVSVWDNFRIGFTDHDRITEVLAGQADFLQRGINRASAQGTNGRYDVFSIAPYFTGGHQYQAGDTDTDMYNDGVVAVDESLMYVDEHLNAGLEPIACYEGGQHMLPTDAEGQGTIQELTQRFADFNNSPEMGLLYQQLLQGCSNRGLDNFSLFVGDIGRWSQFGYWGIKNSWADPDNGKIDVIRDYNGTVPSTGIE